MDSPTTDNNTRYGKGGGDGSGREGEQNKRAVVTESLGSVREKRIIPFVKVEEEGRSPGPQLVESDLHREKNRRVRAEQLVEAEKQTCLELTRLLDLERRKLRQQSRRPSTISDSIAARRRISTASVVTSLSFNHLVVNSRPNRDEEEGGGGEEEKKEDDKQQEQTLEKEAAGLSTVGEISESEEGGGGEEQQLSHLPTQFLFDNFSSTVFEQLPRDLQGMFQVEADEEDYDEGQPPSVLSLAYRAVRTDNPRQLSQHLAVIGQTVLQSVEGAGLLGEACECGSDGCARVLLDAGCPPDLSGRPDGVRALHLATQNDHSSCITLLLKWGADPSIPDGDGQTPLFIALCEGFNDCVDLLMEAGSSLKIITKMDYTVLHAAVSGNMADTLRRLLVSLRTTHDSSSVSHIINYQDKDGNTALHLAASRGYQQCVEVLCGCPQTILNVKDRWNRTALDISTNDCRDILMSKDSKEVVVCVQARLPDTRQATPTAIGRVTVLRHYKCSDVELLAAQCLEQFCHSLRGHIPIPSCLHTDDTESGRDSPTPQTASTTTTTTTEDTESGRNWSTNERIENDPLWSSHTQTWVERIKQDIDKKDSPSHKGGRKSVTTKLTTTTNPWYLKMLWGAQQDLAKMDLGGSSIASYRVGPLSWAPGELGKQQKGKSLHAMVGDRKGGGLGWITSGKPTEIHITLKGHSDGHLDQLAFELTIPKNTLQHYISMVMKDKAVILHGSQGCGKTYLAKSIAEFLKHKLGVTNTHILYLPLHSSFKRDDLFRMLRVNGLLRSVNEVNEVNEKDRDPTLEQNPHIVILDDLDRISGYSTPSILAELLTMLSYRGLHNPTWLDAVYSREGNLLYPAGFYFLKSCSYFIATRTQTNGEALPAAVMDQFSHIPLGRLGEPCSGVLYRQLVSRLIHTRNGDTPHRWDKLYRCVSWVWEIWQLYNNYMKQLDLAELSLGLKHMLQCPVESGSSDHIQSWLCHLWRHHMAPRIEETILHSKRLKGQHHQQTAHLLQRAVVDRAFRPTCPLTLGAAAGLLESLYPSTSSPSTSSSSLPPSLTPPSSHRPRLHSHGHGNNNPTPRSSPSSSSSPTSFKSPVYSTGSVPDIRRGSMKPSEYGIQLSEPPPKKPPRTHKGVVMATDGDEGGDTTSLDRVKLTKATRRKNTLRRLRSRTISLFSKEALNLGREGVGGGGGGVGGGGEVEVGGDNRRYSLTKEWGSTLPRIFKKTKSRPPLPALSENKPIPTTPKLPDRSQELEDFFDMLSQATSNRFDDQRSPAPKSLSLPSKMKQQSSSVGRPPSNVENPDPQQGNDAVVVRGTSAVGVRLGDVPPSMMMSLPDLLSDNDDESEIDTRSNNSIDPRLYSTPEKSHSHSNLQSHSHVDTSTSPTSPLSPKDDGSSLNDVASEERRRRASQRSGNTVGEELIKNPSVVAGSSPTTSLSGCGLRASSLATTAYTYSPNKWERSVEVGGEGGGNEEVAGLLTRDSPDGNSPTESQVSDVCLPRRTFPDGAAATAAAAAAARRHQRVRLSPTDPSGGGGGTPHYRSSEEVREGWPVEIKRQSSPGYTNQTSSSAHNRTSSPVETTTTTTTTTRTPPGDNKHLRPRRVFSEGDNMCDSLEKMAELGHAESSNLLFDAGLGFLSPLSPVVKGLPSRGHSFSGGLSPRLSLSRKTPLHSSEHHEM